MKENQKETPNAAPAEEQAANTAAPESPQAETTGGTVELTQEQFDEIKKRVDALTAERDDMRDTAQRLQAEFNNFRRRTESVRKESYDDGMRKAVELVLPAMDSLERALDAAKEDQSPLAEGVRLMNKQLQDCLQKMGVEKIDAAGKPFDPALHNAVLSEEAEGVESGTVLEELQTGYSLGGKIIRHSIVKVAK